MAIETDFGGGKTGHRWYDMKFEGKIHIPFPLFSDSDLSKPKKELRQAKVKTKIRQAVFKYIDDSSRRLHTLSNFKMKVACFLNHLKTALKLETSVSSVAFLAVTVYEKTKLVIEFSMFLKH